MSDIFQLLGEFVTHCPTCDLDLNHRTTLMNGDLPKKVLCLTCQKEHAYRVPGTAAKKRAATRVLSAQEHAQVRRSREENQWKMQLSDPGKTPSPYSPSMECSLTDHVQHPVFGRGVVIGFSDPDKIQIYFDGDIKILKGRKHVEAAPPKKKSMMSRMIFT